MVTYDVRLRFAERLNEALDEAGYPPKGEGRQAELRKRYKVSQQAAGKWIEGEAMPEVPRIIEIALDTGFAAEWLLSGRGPKKVTPVDFVVADKDGTVTYVQIKETEPGEDATTRALLAAEPASSYQVIRRDPDLVRELVAGVLAPLGLRVSHCDIDSEYGLELEAKWAGDPQVHQRGLPGEIKRPPRVARLGKRTRASR